MFVRREGWEKFIMDATNKNSPPSIDWWLAYQLR